jgi:hypothetical protein
VRPMLEHAPRRAIGSPCEMLVHEDRVRPDDARHARRSSSRGDV